MTREEAKLHIEQIRRNEFGFDDAAGQPSQNPLIAKLRRALKQLATGIFEHAHHYVFELTQNADDNSYPDNADCFLKFVLLEDDPTGTPGSRGCLCVLNDEAGFEKKHVESLCDIGNSTKQGNREGYIGEKGIGFKSVFLISDRPHIISNGYSFHFRRDDCQAGLGYIVPHWDEHVPTAAEGCPTAILLPLRSASGVDVAKQLSDIEPECILFLRRLRRIELVSARTGLNRTVRCDGTDGIFDLDADGTRASYFVHRMEHSCAHIREQLRAGVTSTSVTVALPLTAPEATDGRVFAFLPTEARTGFPFLINADFLLPASRERILDTPEWNKQLVGFAAATFVEAFDRLRGNAKPKHQTLAYRFIPTKPDLLPGANLFAPLVEAVHGALKEKKCVLTESGDCVLPQDACFAGPLSRRLLSEAPPKLATFRLVHPDLENHRKRLEPLGVQVLTISDVLDICADVNWLRDRNATWWEVLFKLLSQNDVSAEVVASFPLLRCQDGVCRCPSGNAVFVKPEGQQTDLVIPSHWPPAHLFDAELQRRLQQAPVAWVWLTKVAGLRQFSVQAYITGSLLDWMREPTGEHAAERLVEATLFVAGNLSELDDHLQTLRETMPWLLAESRVLLPEARAGKGLVTPECIEGDSGWNWVFISGQDRQHFWVLSNCYLEARTDAEKHTIRKLMVCCGATDLPQPARISYPGGRVDWGCPRWLRDLALDEPPQNLDRKIAALERWIGRFTPDSFAKVLICNQDEGVGGIGQTQMSELGFALRNRPWLRSTTGLVTPPVAFVNDPEIKAFLGDSVAYTSSKLDSKLLGKLGVRLRLSADTLTDLLRQMRDSNQVDEACIVRIYRRLQTLEFDAGFFRAEALIYLSIPSALWMQAERVFWNDAGTVFDQYFGYAIRTYEHEELEGFFTKKLGILVDVPAQQLAEVWAQMSGGDAFAPDVVEKRLDMILPKLAAVTDTGEPPTWWPPLRRHLKVWTTRRSFETPPTVFAPDDTFAAEVFANHARIAWTPKTHGTLRLNRLLRSLGCRSLASSLRSRTANAVATLSSSQPKFLTPATKELLICWVCDADGWKDKKQELEQLLYSDEVAVSELRVEYWLDNAGPPVPPVDADAFWSSQDRRLCLRSDATAKAQQSAVATSIAAQFGRPGKQGEDTVYRLLGLEALDARRELAVRKWELTPEQKAWLQSVGYRPEVVELSAPVENQETRESRPPVTPQGTQGGNAAANLPPIPEARTEKLPSSDAQAVPPSSAPSPAAPDTIGTTGGAASGQQGDASGMKQQGRAAENEAESVCPLKSSDAETDFIHVTAHTRSRPRRERQQRETAGNNSKERHPMAEISHATKAELEEAAMQVVMRQFETRLELRSFSKPIDRRKENKGHDVYAAKPGQVLRIEIKAHLRESKSVFVTQNEWKDSRRSTTADRWELWNIENLAADAPGKVLITRYSNLPSEALRESGYWVDLNACHSESLK